MTAASGIIADLMPDAPRRTMSPLTRNACAALLCLTHCVGSGWAQGAAQRSVQGVVTTVTDGDSLWLAAPGQPDVEVRLRDIDAPEICQVWGAEARRALEEWVLGKTVVLRIAGRDHYGRTLGQVLVDEADVGVRMVEEGHAWSVRTKWDRGPLVRQERMARALRRGLHGLPSPVMPRDFRRGHGPCLPEAAAERATPTGAPAAPVVVAAPPPQRPARGETPPAVTLRCDGRTRCSQMRSCAEAQYFLAHCPGVQMDGDGDGIPCESQWCQ
jgi:endonuclease YncB( thermonuclease family)